MNDTQTLTLSEFLLARIAEDEAAAQDAAAAPNVYDPDGDEDSAEAAIAMALNEGCYEQGPEHLRRWLPARVLAECEAKRRIVGQHHEMLTWCQGCAHELYPCRTITALALPYSDHPDFDPAWR